MALNRGDLPFQSELDQAAFTESPDRFAIFNQNTDQKSIEPIEIMRILNTVPVFSGVMRRLKDVYNEFTISCLGAGTGAMEIGLLNEFARIRGEVGDTVNTPIKVHYLDPSATMAESFRARIRSSDLDGAVEIDYQQGTLEEGVINPSDLILLPQTLYYVRGWRDEDWDRVKENPLEKVLKAADTKNGLTVITIQAEGGNIFELRNTMLDRPGGESESSWIDVAKALLVLKRTPYAYYKMLHLAVDNCFQNDKFNPTEEGTELLEFIFRGQWQGYSSDKKKEIGRQVALMTMKNSAKNDEVPIDINGKLVHRFLTINNGYFFVKREEK